MSRFSWFTVYNVCILSILLYGFGCWTVSKSDVQRIDAHDQWCLRRFLSIFGWGSRLFRGKQCWILSKSFESCWLWVSTLPYWAQRSGTLTDCQLYCIPWVADNKTSTSAAAENGYVLVRSGARNMILPWKGGKYTWSENFSGAGISKPRAEECAVVKGIILAQQHAHITVDFLWIGHMTCENRPRYDL